MTQQVETATVIGAITAPGNAKVVVTSGRLATNPTTVTAAVLNLDAATVVASNLRTALALNAAISDLFSIGGTGANISLTRRVGEANDVTLNIAIDNDTCTGLTAAPTSTDTTAGVGIANGYATLQNFKDYHAITSTNVVDDSVIEVLIESASRYIDNETGRRFYASAASTHYYDVPKHTTTALILDDDLASVSAVVNGDGSTFSSTNYVLQPYNGPPYSAIQLVGNASETWQLGTNGNPLRAISVIGTFGSTVVPTDIRDACVIIAVQAYHRRFGDKAAQDTLIMPSGMVINPAEVPSRARTIINNHRKIGIG